MRRPPHGSREVRSQTWPFVMLAAAVALGAALLAAACSAATMADEHETPTPGAAAEAVVPHLVRELERTPSPSPTPLPTATPTQHIVDGVVILPCGDPLVPVDKGHRLTSDCVPANLGALPVEYTSEGTQLLTTETRAALIDMIDDARSAGLSLWAASSFRSFAEQADLFAFYKKQLGYEEASRRSAEAGHSEHQLGTTTDLVRIRNDSLDSFPGSAEAAWVEEHSWEYGFIVSYPAGKEAITGYIHEPWHIRYVGTEIAVEVEASGLTLGEFLHERWP